MSIDLDKYPLFKASLEEKAQRNLAEMAAEGEKKREIEEKKRLRNRLKFIESLDIGGALALSERKQKREEQSKKEAEQLRIKEEKEAEAERERQLQARQRQERWSAEEKRKKNKSSLILLILQIAVIIVEIIVLIIPWDSDLATFLSMFVLFGMIASLIWCIVVRKRIKNWVLLAVIIVLFIVEFMREKAGGATLGLIELYYLLMK